MAKKIQILGFILIIVGAILISLSMTMAWNNSNAISFGSAGLVIARLVTYVVACKKAINDDITNK